MSLRALIRSVLFLGGTAVLLFGSAGRFDLPFFWAFLGVVITFWLVMLAIIDRDLLQERMNPGPGGVDRSIRFTLLPVFAGLLIVAGLDAGRYGWSRVPVVAQGVGLALVAGGYVMSLWAVQTNRFFSPVVRIQPERGHHVITAGPYAFIRHPGYAGSLMTLLGSAVALGSWWAEIGGVLAAALIVRRLLIEDRYLRAHLDGYTAYAGRVRYRIVPGLW